MRVQQFGIKRINIQYEKYISMMRKQKCQEQPQVKSRMIFGIDLGNHTTTVYFKDRCYSFRTELTINCHQEEIIIGQQPINLQQTLKTKHKQLSQGQYIINSNNNNNYLSQQNKHMNINIVKSTRILDMLDLFVKYLTRIKTKLHKHLKSIFSNQLPSCFSYYEYEWRELSQVDDSIEIVLDEKQCINGSNRITIRLDQSISVFITSIITYIISLNNQLQLQLQQRKHSFSYDIEFIFTHYGYEGNHFLSSLDNFSKQFMKSQQIAGNSIQINGEVSSYFIYSTTAIAVCYYIEHLQSILQQSIVIGALNFGSRGCSFTLFKLYPSQQNVIETLQHFVIQFGGVDITRVIVDYFIQHVKIHCGVNIKSTSTTMKELYKLADETRMQLYEHEKVYVRIQGYPLNEPYSFYVNQQVIEHRIKQKISTLIGEIVKLCQHHVGMQNVLHAIVQSGSCCQLPLFKLKLTQSIITRYNCQLINFQKDQISRGNYLYRTTGVVLLQRSMTEITIKGDYDYEEILLQRNCQLPVRLVRDIEFPRGELSYKLKVVEDQREVICYVIEIENLQWGEKINFIIQKEEHRGINIYSTKYLGKISVRGSNLCKGNSLFNSKYKYLVYRAQ